MRVCPSGVDLVSIAVASMPLAPGRLSTMICCFMFSPIFAAIARALMSVAAPGAYVTSTRIGRVGDV